MNIKQADKVMNMVIHAYIFQSHFLKNNYHLPFLISINRYPSPILSIIPRTSYGSKSMLSASSLPG